MTKQILFIICITLIYVSCFAQGNTIRLMTYNIKYENDLPGEEWSLRKDKVVEMISFHKPDVFGLQEALKTQIDYIAESLPDYSWIGVGRDDGGVKGEYSPIYYNSRFLLLESNTLWLSSTPKIPSIGWDAALNRIITSVKLFDTVSDDTIQIFNTHFDHIGKNAREESAKLIVRLLDLASENNSILLMGDFNTTDTTQTYHILNNSLITDASKKARFVNYGTSVTFNGFNHDLREGRRIDYIFANNRVDVLHHAIIGDKFDGKYPSDHMPVIIDFEIQTLNK